MSFTSNIKNEISSIEYGESEKMAELSAILNIEIPEAVTGGGATCFAF